jgi:hypothetical protein
MSADALILGEAKWNSAVGSGQGVAKDRTQLDLRLAYCEELAPRLLPAVKHRVVLGVGRTNEVFPESRRSSFAAVRNLTWSDIASLFAPSIASELESYLAWRSSHALDGPRG